VTGVRCVRNSLGAPGGDGRRSPVPIPGSDFVVSCDSVVVAVGQRPELAFLDGSRIARDEGGGVLVDGTTQCAGPPGLYAGGDVVVEPGSIISACADGRRAAEAICAHLGTGFAQPSYRRPCLSESEIVAVKSVRARRVPQVAQATLPVGERRSFALIDETFTEEEARAEALRCVQCSTFCDKCVEVCPNRANYTFRIEPVCWELPVLAAQGSSLAAPARTETFRVTQDRQILHVDDFCNECDNCQTFCVHHGRPYADKPRLFLDPTAFETERSNAFHIAGNAIRRREDGVESRLTVTDQGMIYEVGPARVELTADWRVVGEAPALPLRPAAEMLLLYRGVKESLAFLLLR
jgi:putative selenate reductase